MTVIYLLLALCFGLYAWQDLRNAVLILIVLLPTYLLRIDFLGIPTTLLELMLLLAIVIGFIRLSSIYSSLVYPSSVGAGFSLREWINIRFINLRRLKPAATIGFGLGICLVLVSATIGIFISPDKLAALGVYKAYFLEPLAFGLLLFVLLSQKKLTQEKLLSALGLSAILISIVAIVQWFIPLGIPIPWDIERRVTSVFDFPNAVGLYLAPIVTLAWIKSKENYRWFVVSILGSIAIVLAQSEAAIVAVIVSVFIFLLTQKQTRKLALILGILTVLLAGVSPFRSMIVEKLTLQDYSGQVRLSQWNEAWNMLRDRPVFGAGLSGYTTALAPYHQAKQYEIFQYPHNLFLNIWTELGLLGLVGFGILVVTILRRLKPAATIKGNFDRMVFFFPLLTMFIHGLVDVPFFKNDLSVLTVIFMILFFYATKQNKSV